MEFKNSMSLSVYHWKYAERSNAELERRAAVKEEELKKIFNATNFRPTSDSIRVAVLGCADARFVPAHKKIFENLLARKIEMTTFDITAEHLKNEEGIIEHDLTIPLPNPPYDITFGHVVLKFIETEKQWDVILNSYDALAENGIAIHVFDAEDVTTTSVRQADGYFSVPLARWEKQLTERGIKFQELHWDITLEEIPIPIRGLKGGALVLIK